MSVAMWPADLPQRVLRRDFGMSVPDGRTLVPPEAGPMLGHLRFSSAAAPVSASMMLTARTLARFLRFWNEDLGHGIKPFLIRDQLNDGLPMLTADGEPILVGGMPILVAAWWLCSFGGKAPAISVPGGSLRQLSFELQVMPR